MKENKKQTNVNSDPSYDTNISKLLLLKSWIYCKISVNFCSKVSNKKFQTSLLKQFFSKKFRK